MIMRLHRKTIWIGVAVFALCAGIFVFMLEQQGAQFSFRGSVIPQRASTTPVRVQRYPELNGPSIAITSGGSAEGGMTLHTLLSLVEKERTEIFAIRSLDGVYPDGTSPRYEVLYDASGTTRRIEANATGILSDSPLSSVPIKSTPFPSVVPDSTDALLQLVTNPYFSKAHAMGIALYFEPSDKRWSYVIRTDLGDVNILLPNERVIGGSAVRAK